MAPGGVGWTPLPSSFSCTSDAKYCAWQRTCMRCTARRAALAVLLLTALPVSRGWSVMDQYYRIGTRLWSFSDSGITEPSAFVHDPRHVHGRAAAGPRARA